MTATTRALENNPLRAAVFFLTRWPVGAAPLSAHALRAASGYFPLVGAALGLAMGLAGDGAARAGPLVAAAVSIALGVIWTGALHEDGLADTADALGAGRDREHILLILKDSRIGTYGGAALALSLILRIALVARLAPSGLAPLVLAEGVSRVVPVWLMAALPYVTPAATSKSGGLVEATALEVGLASALALALLGGAVALRRLTWFELGCAALATVFVASACGAYFRRRLGGVTGDLLGASQQLAVVALLLALAIARGGAA